MANIITTLHPQSDENTNLYPNIIRENIPDGAVSREKLDPTYLESVDNSFDEVNQRIEAIGDGSPRYVNTSTNILALTTNQGIAVATDNGHWYYWNGTQYADGGVYQSTAIADGSINKAKINTDLIKNILLDNKIKGKIVINEESVTTKLGMYTSISSYNSAYTQYKCVKFEIANCDCLDFEMLQGVGISTLFYRTIEGVAGSIDTASGVKHLDLSNIYEIAINFFGSSICSDFIITKNNVCQKLNNEMMINKSNIQYRPGLFLNFNDYQNYSGHQCSYKYKCSNLKSISFKSGGYAFPQVVWKDKNNNVYGSSNSTTNYIEVDVSNAVEIAFNFFDEVNVNYLITFKDINSIKILNKYNHYNIKGLTFNNTKSALFVGDSITVGFTSGTTTTPNGYPKLFSDHYSMTYYNEAVGGAEYCNDGDYQGNVIPRMLTQITNSTHKNVNYLFIAGGINDWQSQNDLTTFKNAVSDTIDYALNNYPNAQIMLITPINTTTSFSATPKNITIQEYRNIITEVAISKNSDRITIIQGNLFNFPDENNDSFYISEMFGDGLHPSEKGYRTAYLHGLIDTLS